MNFLTYKPIFHPFSLGLFVFLKQARILRLKSENPTGNQAS